LAGSTARKIATAIDRSLDSREVGLFTDASEMPADSI
jgi:hypothetical protein